MNMNRRDFLKMLFGATAFAVLEANAGTRMVTRFLTPDDQKDQNHDRDNLLLLDSMLETLKLNEGFHLEFYRCTADKVTVGCGSNVQSNPRLLDGVTIYRSGKALTDDDRKKFLDGMKTVSKSDLAKYTVSREDATKMARQFFKTIVPEACRFLSRDDGKTFFYDMPLCMQALAMDVLYNVGDGEFRKFKKFKAALARKDYSGATDEAKVYTNKEKKEVNKNRERRKQRMRDIMRLVQNRSDRPTKEILAALEADCLKQLKGKMDSASCQKEIKCEKLLAIGEIEHIRMMRERSRALVQQKSAQMSAQPMRSDRQAAQNDRPKDRGVIR